MIVRFMRVNELSVLQDFFEAPYIKETFCLVLKIKCKSFIGAGDSDVWKRRVKATLSDK